MSVEKMMHRFIAQFEAAFEVVAIAGLAMAAVCIVILMIGLLLSWLE